MSKKVAIIGSGFAGLTAAISLADKGFKVTIIEKNQTVGGRARKFEQNGFTFDMGPSWYWMPDVFENFFNKFGKSSSDYYDLVRLDPSYRVFFSDNDFIDLPANYDKLGQLFEEIEPGSSIRLNEFLRQAAYKYDVGINDLVFKPGRSLLEFVDKRVLGGVFRMDLFQSMSNHIRKFFKNERLIQLLEFPVLFLGATPENTPALYSLMNYADINLGTWYPKGGMHNVIEALHALAIEKGVCIKTNQSVVKLEVTDSRVSSVITSNDSYDFDIVVAGADYNHVEQHLLEPQYRQYSAKYWENRDMAPSSLIFYLGINKKLKNLLHHNLFFDEDFKAHAKEIYDSPRWPSKPLFYVSVTSKTDDTVAPKGGENVFILMPIAPGLEDDESIRDTYYELLIDRLEHLTKQPIKDHVIMKKSYCIRDFIKDYNAFKGNAYGLANTLKQTAILKPSMKSKKLKNLYYAGQLTVPGPGVPPSIISGQVVANEVEKDFSLTKLFA
ncbi:MAG: phytoene desaturase family protein [Cyclobacteriaceae bacterium]